MTAWRALRDTVGDGVRCAAPAALLSGVPSTLHALLTGRDPLEATLAAGSIVLPREQRRARLVAAAVPVHLAISTFWAVLLSAVLPRERPVIGGAVAGAALAAIDLGVLGRRFPTIEALPRAPQVADHIAFGVITAVALSRLETPRGGKT